MNDESTTNIQHKLGFCLLRFEALCHFKLMKCLVDISKCKEPKPKYGCEAGLNTFLSFGYRLEGSVFLYESIKHFSLLAKEDSTAFTKQPYYPDLEVIRNNIHTYFKKGGFAEKANALIDEKLREYKLNEPSIFKMLRNDISLVFQTKNNSRYLIGCDYFIYHCIFESKNKNWSGLDYLNYGKYLSTNIKAIALTVDESQYQLSELNLLKQMPTVELFDYKSRDLFNGCPISPTITFRLMLMLYQISYILLLTEEILDCKKIEEDDMWTFFFGKLLAIEYDESFDNLQSIQKFSSEEDGKTINEFCKTENLRIEALSARKFAQKLRNTIHYQELYLDINKIKNESAKSIIEAIYLSNTSTNSIAEFRDKTIEMVIEMKKLQKVIRGLISVGKDYSH